MAKKTITIVADNAAGERGVLVLRTEGEWLALRVRDAKRMDGFTPSILGQLIVAGDDGAIFNYVPVSISPD